MVTTNYPYVVPEGVVWSARTGRLMTVEEAAAELQRSAPKPQVLQWVPPNTPLPSGLWVRYTTAGSLIFPMSAGGNAAAGQVFASDGTVSNGVAMAVMQIWSGPLRWGAPIGPLAIGDPIPPGLWQHNSTANSSVATPNGTMVTPQAGVWPVAEGGATTTAGNFTYYPVILG